MMKIRTYIYNKVKKDGVLCCLFLMLLFAPQATRIAARADYPRLASLPRDKARNREASPVVLSKVWVEGDSVVVGIRFDFAGVSVRPYLALWFSPVLKGEKRYLVLPAVVVSGKVRARADRRNRFLTAGRANREPEPYHVLKGNSPKRGNGCGGRHGHELFR